MNVLFFIGTVYYLVDHWRKAAGVINSQVVEIPIWNKYSFQPFAYCPKQSLRAQVRSNFLIVLKLFFIMGTFQALINRNNETLLLGHWYEIVALYYVKLILTEISASRQDRRVLQKSKIIRIEFLSKWGMLQTSRYV